VGLLIKLFRIGGTLPPQDLIDLVDKEEGDVGSKAF
jgi:hypothetical protein